MLGWETGDAPLPLPSIFPANTPLPESGPSSARCSPARGHLPSPGSPPSPQDGAGHAVGSSSGPARMHQSHIGGREQLCCHGGEEAAERETFPRREESVGDEGRGLLGFPTLGGINLCKVWRWRCYICLSIDGVGG